MSYTTIPGGEQDWAGINYLNVERRRGRRGKALQWHRIAGIKGRSVEMFEMRCGYQAHFPGNWAHIELLGRNAVPTGMADRCRECYAPEPRPVPEPEVVMLRDGLSDEDVDRIAQRVVELAREAEREV